MEAVKTVSDLFMLVSCEIIQKNKNFLHEPILVNFDPYGEGRMAKIELGNIEEVKKLLALEKYKEITG